jgi:hypothetical protein
MFLIITVVRPSSSAWVKRQYMVGTYQEFWAGLDWELLSASPKVSLGYRFLWIMFPHSVRGWLRRSSEVLGL